MGLEEDISKLSVEDRIKESGLFYFDDGYLGSTNHCVGYYYGRNRVGDMDKIESGETSLEYLILNDEFFKENEVEGFGNWNDFFDHWFSDSSVGDFEIIEDLIEGDDGYGKFTINKISREIKIEVVPCLYGGDNMDGLKIFGFLPNGELVRNIDRGVLELLLLDPKLNVE
jgi:hypothetical protein